MEVGKSSELERVLADDRLGAVRTAGSEFHDRIAEHWSRGYERAGFRRRLECFRRILRIHVLPGQTWLDLGCGSGVLTKELIELGAANVVAVDGSPAMLRHGAGAVEAPAGTSLAWIVGDAQAVTFLSSDSFDGVVCSSVIEYVDRPDAVLREIARVLRPEGSFVISLPPTSSFIRTFQKAIRWMTRWLGQDSYSYLAVSRFEGDPGTLSTLFGSAGLAISRVTKFDAVLPQVLLNVFRPSLLVIEGRKRVP